MRIPGSAAAPLLAAAVAFADAQFLVNELSFGHSGLIETTQPDSIPNFRLSGTPTQPQLLSNKLILTPPVPGNARAAVWAVSPLQHRSWVADVDFRATGPERAGGNLNVWLARGGSESVGLASIYSVGKFDGLALVVDTHGGSGGMVRGFLNDGTIDFSSRHSVDDLAFGLCDYSYRNLGRPSQLKFRQDAAGFKVEVDGRLCFQTDKFSIPTGYKLGVTAATPDNPDSFEVFKIVVMSGNSLPEGGGSDGGDDGTRIRLPSQNNMQKQPSGSTVSAVGGSVIDGSIPDADPDTLVTSKAQFADLHNRLQSVNHHLGTILNEIGRTHGLDDRRQAEVSKMIVDLTDEVRRLAGIEADLGKRVASMEKEVRQLKGELHSRVTQSERAIKGYFSDQHASLTETVLERAGGHKRLILFVLALQVIAAGAYVWYKRKRNSTPKKFL